MKYRGTVVETTNGGIGFSFPELEYSKMLRPGIQVELTVLSTLPLVDAEDMKTPGVRVTVEKVKKDLFRKLTDSGISVKKIGVGRTSLYDLGTKYRAYTKVSLQEPPCFFGLGPDVIERYNDGTRQFCVLLLADETRIYRLPWEDMNELFKDVMPAITDGEWKFNTTTSHKLILSGKPSIDISKYRITVEDLIREVK